MNIYRDILEFTLAIGIIVVIMAFAIQPSMGQTPTATETQQQSISDNTFVVEAYAGGLAEIEASKQILKRSENDKLKKFAEQMVQDHQSTNIKLKNFAEDNDINLPQIPANEEDLNKLARLNDQQLEEAYVKMMQNNHDKAVALFEHAAATADLNADLRTLASQTLPVLRMHQQHAHLLSNLELSQGMVF